MRKLLFAVMAFGIISTHVYASNWVLISSDSQVKDYIDADSLARDGDEITVWEKTIYNKPNKSPDGKLFSALTVKTIYNCDRQTYKTLYYQASTKNGTLIHHYNVPYYKQTDEPIVPDSVGDTILKYICSYTK